MALYDDILTFVNSAAPGLDPKPIASKLHDSGAISVVSGALSIRADAAAAAVFKNGALPTRLSSAALALAILLRELKNRGVIDIEIHDGPGVTLQEIV